jgi:hypothetical protein
MQLTQTSFPPMLQVEQQTPQCAAFVKRSACVNSYDTSSDVSTTHWQQQQRLCIEHCFSHAQATVIETISDARSLIADDKFKPPPLTAPGVIEAEYFGPSGQNISYYNLYKGEPSTKNNSVRKSKMTINPLDIKRPKDVSLGYIVGWTGPSEWMSYNVRDDIHNYNECYHILKHAVCTATRQADICKL